jgi:hypothetical protein
MARKLISAPSPDEYRHAPRHPLPHFSQSHKQNGNKIEATSARHSYEGIEQPHHPLDPNNDSEYWSESEQEPELEDVRNTPYSGQSHTHYAESQHYGPDDQRRHRVNATQDSQALYDDEPEDEYEGESSHASRASFNVQAHSTRKDPKLRKNKSIESTTPRVNSILHIPKIRSIKVSILKLLIVKISKLDQESRNIHIKLKLQDRDRKPDMVELRRILMVRD